MNLYYTPTDHFVLLPAIMLALFGCAILLFDFLIFPDPKQRKWLLWFVFPGLGFTGYELYRQQRFLSDQGIGSLSAFQGTLTVDGLAIFFNWIFLAATALVAMVSYRYFEEEDEHHGEYYGLLLLAQCGMFFLATGTELVTVLVGLELMALCFYVMVGFLRGDRRSNEAAIKYVLLGAFSTGFLAYGFSILYGMSGSTRLADVAAAVAARDTFDPMAVLALVTVSVGLLFKVAAVPFHMWAPDAYEGAPTPVTAFLAVASKAASFAFLIRMYTGVYAPSRALWEPLLIWVAVLSLVIGNLAAISQTNVKRLLAYSSISHVGYLLFGVIAGGTSGVKAAAIYLMVYLFMTLGAFLVVIAMRRKGLIGDDLADLGGLVHKSPVHAFLMLIFMLSLAGIPPTAGFIAKYYIFLALIETGRYMLAVIGALMVAVAIYYYFRIVRSMFLTETASEEPLASSVGLRVALGIAGLMTLAIGVYPEPLLRMAQQSFGR
jgi:NADH-quinone oxidoreductase subunit N